MKKIFPLLAILLFLSPLLFAEKQVVHSLQLTVPIEHQTWTDEGSDDHPSFLGFGLGWSRMTVRDSGYSFLLGAGLGFTKASWSNLTYGDVDPNGFDLNFKVGLGFAPLHNDKMILAFHGFWAIDTKILSAHAEYEDSFDYYESDFLMFDTVNVLGLDAAFVMKLSDSFGLSAGIDVSMNLLGMVLYDDGDDGIWGFGIPSGKINVIPRFGICWVL